MQNVWWYYTHMLINFKMNHNASGKKCVLYDLFLGLILRAI